MGSHSQHFVDPTTGAKTQIMERECKTMMRQQKSMYFRPIYKIYVQFDKGDGSLLSHITSIYPV